MFPSIGNQLEDLEAESIYILREIAGQFERPVLLFSGGKDSVCLLRLAEKAFRPAKFPFPLLHIDTGHNFPELIIFRDRRAKDLQERLIIRTVEEALLQGIAIATPGETGRNQLQIPTLLAALAEFHFDCAIGGARRDEEKARAKERIFSLRDPFGQWDPKNQRPELWNLFNGKLSPGESMRAFPISNWTELDVWTYIQKEQLQLPSIYFSHQRNVVWRDDQWLPVSPLLALAPREHVQCLDVRVRTIGDITCTGCIPSDAETLQEIIQEVASARVTERGSRADDKRSEAAMEDRKKVGYF